MSRAARAPLPNPKPFGPAELERFIQDEKLFRQLVAQDDRLPDSLRRPAAVCSSGAISLFSTAWIREQHRKRAAGELDDEDVEMLRAVEPFADRELYAACVTDGGAPVGFLLTQLPKSFL